MIEQPLEYDDLVSHAALQSRIKTPICLDESVRSVSSVRVAMELGSCGVVNIKTGRVGGLLEGRRIHDLCAAYSVPVWMGGMFETGIGRAFNIALASLDNFSLPADMSPALMYFESDLVDESFELRDGLIAVPTAPGIGFTVSPLMLAKYTVEDVTLR
jgi:O-succinylbenzoate synthase